MADESISIEITDKVQPTIDVKLITIAKSARDAHTAVESLSAALKQIGGTSSLSKLQTDSTRLSAQLLRNAQAQEKLALATSKTQLSNQKLATETQRTQAAMAAVETALNKAIIAEDKAASSAAKLAADQAKAQTAAQQLATAQQQTAAAAAKALTANQQLSTAQQQTAQAAARAAQAQTQATTAVTQGATAQAALSTATARTATAQTQSATATAKLATEQQRTVIQTNNAAAAATRAELATLRLEQAQARLTRAMTPSVSALGQFVRNAAAMVGVSIGVHEIISLADAYTVLGNKLQNVSTSQAQVAELTNRLFIIANESRQNVDATATSFARFDRALKFLGKSQDETLRLTETVNKALVIGGATAQESASALLQLSQAFNAGVLQGDEFRAVAENMPMVLDAVAKVLNKPIDQIKTLGRQGKITASVMYDAFKLMQEGVDKTFAKTIPTISQAMTVLRNNFEQSIGRFNQATGITAGLSAAIIGLANNLDILAVAVTVVGTALLVYFGPVLLAALGTATAAVWAFTVAIASNPIGLLAVAIAASIVAIMEFGDKVKVVANTGATLKDEMLAAFSFIKDGFMALGSSIKDAWNAAIDFINEKTGGWAEKFRDIWPVIQDVLKWNINTVIGLFELAYKTITITWRNLPTVLNGFFIDIVNFCSTAISQIMNLWQVGLRSIADMVSGVTPELSKNLLAGLDALKIELPKLDVSPAAQDVGKQLKDAVTSALTTDFVGDAVNGVMSRANEMARTRTRNARNGVGEGSNLRGSGPNLQSPQVDKAAEARAKAMAKVNGELDNEINRMFMLKPLREAQAKFDQIELSLKQKKITLTAAEAQSIKDRIKLIQDNNFVQAEFDRMYETSIEPIRTHNSALTAANKLLQQGTITQRQYNGEVAGANETFLKASQPIHQYTKELNEQISLLKLAPPARAAEQQMIQISNDLLSKNIVLTAGETEELHKLIAAQAAAANQSAAMDTIYAATTGAAKNLQYQQDALTKSYANGTITQEYFKNQMAQTAIAVADLQNQLGNGDMFSVFTAAAGQALQGFSTMATGVSNILGNVMQTSIDGFSSSVAGAIVKGENLRDSIHGIAQTILTDMLGALIKLGIQYLINATIGEAALSTSTAASMVAAGAMATAWAPAAAAVSLASWGSNGVAAVAAIAAANIASQSFAHVKGFREGGFTGSVGVNEVAGVVHGKEFVMDAGTTNRIGVQDLEALRSGAASVKRNSTQVGTSNPTAADTKSGEASNARGQRLPNPIVMHLHGVTDADSFKRSEGQIAARMGQAIDRANQRNN